MARLLVSAMEHAGYDVEIASGLRSYTATPDDPADVAIREAATAEIERLSALWTRRGAPDLWFAYHPYYKTPDLIGPVLCRRFGIAYATAEASWSRRRDIGQWARAQAEVLEAVRGAAVNFCFTRRDAEGLRQAAPDAVFAPLAPFLDPGLYVLRDARPQPERLVAVAMMRPGDKMASYAMLAEALARIGDEAWSLSIIGDGRLRHEVEALFSRFREGRVLFHGEQTEEGVAALLSESAIHVWPGCGEAYGLAYLEAQAAGLPVVAQATAGVPEVVRDGVTGLLTPQGDIDAYAEAIRRLLHDEALRQTLGANARRFVLAERSIGQAAQTLDRHLRKAMVRR